MTASTHKSRSKSKRISIALLLLLLLLIFLFRGGDDEFSYIGEKAKTLDFEQAKIVRFVQEEVKREDYPGAFRGAIGTLWGVAGNEEDSAQLLSALLSASKIENELAQEGGQFGVRLLEDDELIMIQSIAESATVTTVERVDNISITFLSDESEAAAASYEGKAGDFLRSPLRVSIRERLATLRNGVGEILLETPIAPGTRLVMRISFHLPDGSLTTVRRELAPGGEQNPPMPAEHVVVFAPGTIEASVFKKQTELLNTEWGKDSPSSLVPRLRLSFGALVSIRPCAQGLDFVFRDGGLLRYPACSDRLHFFGQNHRRAGRLCT